MSATPNGWMERGLWAVIVAGLAGAMWWQFLQVVEMGKSVARLEQKNIDRECAR